ncbi:phosphoenolpyruvate--protein phosphotransferase [Brevibacillus borstelensis]|jgi:phosphoenolpyruvate-protein phosphotransferase (PTS system enzyme I)|uniref:phosphoenolpyruvate--protein phosphotransferase n=1 Tax=Brevibacillus borstelensis TaxID=45462 RepID=UPI000F07A78D|nr:phosphoenolpyruvate--protein phosphotransferase [Brevibacillus borstelensis]MED1883049.1 phosphoenolpyruvate--protein phosphotransferase [Brevibacillus borstelensis]RNB55949.1 phosphoenolpyruvate--protein phosphotransferase [Brevibacillus borstelensis]GED54896.1 phosphoenolpyruvate-protein phosphotransferase [Brevibacillus borstelensis]
MFKGIPVSAGIAIAPIAKLTAQSTVATNDEKIDSNRKTEELQCLEQSIELAKEQLSQLKEKALDQLGPEKAEILSAHIAFLDDPSFTGEMKARIENQLCSAQAAVQQVAGEFVALFEGMDNDYMKERADDIRDVSRRLLKNLSGGDSHSIGYPEEPFILVAEDVTPSETLQLPLSLVKGIATAKGGPTSHAAILARSLGIPAVMGGGEAFLTAAETGKLMILDGATGELFLDPDEGQLASFRERAEQEAADRETLEALKDLPAVTLDGHRVHVVANMAVPEETEALVASGLDGVGLFRSEFLFMDRSNLPDEEEQFTAYQRVVSAFQGKPVIIRTLDVGGDKHLPALALPREDNPFLGFRAIRISLARPELFRTQLRALLRASAYGRLLIMFPMISHLEQLREAKRLLEEVKAELRTSGIPFDEEIAIGMMMEIPGACLQADAFAKEVQFFSIGTNDLVQYTLAVDRMNENIAHLYSYYHPAVLRLISHVINASHRAGIWTGLCGEMASDPLATELLLGMGLNEFSGAAAVMPKVKARIRSTTMDQAKQVARHVLSLSSAEEVYSYLRDKTE